VSRVAASIPAAEAGIGLRAPHYRALLDEQPDVGFLEVHSENYFGAGGAPHYYLEQSRRRYPLSLHGVGLSLGSADPLDRRHLASLKRLIERYEPALVSDHLCWNSIDGRYLNDLLPLPYTEETLTHFVRRVDEAQEYLGRELLIENPSSYLQFRASTIPEWEFLAEVARRSGCGILLDINNVYVSACNHGSDADMYLAAMPRASVREFHLAGHTVKRYPEGEFANAPSLGSGVLLRPTSSILGVVARDPRLDSGMESGATVQGSTVSGFDPTGEILIDTHSAPVQEAVWALYRKAVAHFGPVPTLIEWDTDLPELAVLVAEAHKAQRVLDGAPNRGSPDTQRARAQ
jgi:uncharacterized protein (UPF0276 family)